MLVASPGPADVAEAHIWTVALLHRTSRLGFGFQLTRAAFWDRFHGCTSFFMTSNNTTYLRTKPKHSLDADITDRGTATKVGELLLVFPEVMQISTDFEPKALKK